MNYRILAVLLSLLISVILESSLVSFPLLVLISCMIFFLNSSKESFFLIFIASLILDSLRVLPIGANPIFIFIVFLVLDLYRKNFETADVNPVIFLILVSLLVYAMLAGYFPGIVFFIIFAVTAVILLRFANLIRANRSL